MASETLLNKARHEETAVMSHSERVKRSSLQNQFARLPKEKKVLAPVGSMNTKFQDKATALKSGKLSRQAVLSQHASKRSPVQSTPLKSSKPWPGRKAAGLDELVKHMSNVPSYLQRMDRGANLQDKALNFGVLEWGLLERWTNHQNRVANGNDRASPSNSNESSSFSKFESSTQSSESTGSSAPSQGKQFPTTDGHKHSSALMGTYPDNSIHSADERISLPNSVAGHGLQSAHAIGTVDLRSHDGNVPRGLFSSTSTSDDVSAFALKLIAAKDAGIKREEKFQNCCNNLYTEKEWRECHGHDLSDNGECIWDHLQQNFQDVCISSESPVTDDGMETERNCSRFSVDFPGDIQLADQSPRVPYSCPLPRTIIAEKPDIGSILLSEDIVTNTEGKDKNRRRVIASPADRSSQGDANSRITAGRKSTNYLSTIGVNRMSRSSSLKEDSSVCQSEPIACANKCDKETSKDRDRRSPLRRLLDPLLRPKSHTYFSGPIGSSRVQQSCESTNTRKPLRMEELASFNEPHRLVDRSIYSTCRAKKSLNMSLQIASKSEGCFQQEKRSPSTRQALLQLAWKNGLPLFMLSCGDCDILAATVRKKNIFDKDELECVYTIFTVQDSKKKSGAWVKPGNKTKKQNLVSNTVGEMRVSCSRSRCCSSKNCRLRRQFVLVRSEMIQTSHEPGDSQFSSELAAIVCKVPQGMPETSNGVALHKDSADTNSAAKICSCCQPKDLQTARSNENSSLCSVSVILPSGIHGLSTSGEPSPLIERWESGGVCDCGGWDEGCMLTVLTDDFQKCTSSGSAEVGSDTDDMRRFELFSQGRSRENGHAFSMVSFKEGLYTIEFRASITLLQAFVICIARLHSRYPTRQQVERQGLGQHPFSDHERKIPARRQSGVPTSYIPNHPPLSPVGRA
ncbi:uncharacterized protein [Typha latifolia]|uniref:uncharacterized protein n=1 Tax=Typha latifolia TaxID=4733 RepID=UPI003C2F4851